MKNLINYLSKKSLSLGNGSGMTRKWFGNDSGMTRFSLASLICLCMLTVGVGNAWADYTIGFGTDGSNWISSGGDYVDSYSTSGSVYKESSAIRFGKGSGTGSITVDLTSSGTYIGQIKASKITLNGVVRYGSDASVNVRTTVTYTGSDGSVEDNYTAPTSAGTHDIVLDGTKTIASVRVESTTNGKRFYCTGFTVTAAASCAKKVTITKGTPESGGAFSLDKTGAQDCCEALTVTVSGITAPSGKKFSAITQSGIASGVTIDQSAKTVTYAANSNGSSTINVTFESKGCTDHYGTNVTSGSTQDNKLGPCATYYKYSTRQILYTKTDLNLSVGKKGTIKSISFDYATASDVTRNVTIYMANTSLTSLSNTAGSFVPFSEFTQVYTGSVTFTAGYNEIELSSNYEYNGIGNLVVLIDDNTGSYVTTDYFNTHTASTITGNAQIWTGDDDTNQDPSATSWTGYTPSTSRPNTKFCIQEADMTPATVTLMDNGATITEVSAGAGVTLPSRAGCTGYTFAGWTKTWVAPQSSWTTTAPTIIPAGSYTPSANENLYPVYTKTEGGGSPEFSQYQQVALGGTITAGKYLISTGSYTMAGNGKTGVSLTPGTTEAAAREYTVAIVSGTTITIKGPDNKYIGGLDKADGLTFSTTTPSSDDYRWVYTENGIQNKSITGRHIKAYSTTDFRHYGTGNGTLTYFYKRIETSGSTTSYISVPNCCTDPGLNYGTGSVTKTYGADAFTNTLTNSHSVAVTYSSSDPTVATVNGSGQVTILKAGSTTITASSAAQTVTAVSYCADEASYTLTVNKANISPTLTYTPNSVAVGENTSAPTVGGNPGSGGVTYTITSATPAGCATINTSTGVVTGVAVGSVTVTATVAATTNYNGGSATANVTITAASYFTNGATVFIQAESSSAWDASACVKAWFNNNGAGGAAQETFWLFDATGGDAGKKLFATVVPASGSLNQVTLQRFDPNSDCDDFWNANGTLTKASDGGSNTFRSTGSGNSNLAWNGSGITLSLYGDPNSWGSSLGTFADQGNGVWTATYNNYAPANAAGETQEFKISTNYNGWIGNTGSNNNATLDGMHVGSTYNITATLDVTTHALTMSKTFVKGTVHFNLQGHGLAISDLENVAAGSKISSPSPAPSATGYTFGGWFTDAECTDEWDFASDEVNETMTLYAKWTADVYTITKTLTNVSNTGLPASFTYTGATTTALNSTFTVDATNFFLPSSIAVTMGGTPLTAGTDYTYNNSTGAFTFSRIISGNIVITATATAKLKSIAITTQPTTRKYFAGESFSSTGAVVTATMGDGSTKAVTASTTWTPSGALSAGTSQTVTASYTENGITKTATTTIDVYSVTVNKKNEDGDAIDVAGVTATWTVGTKALAAGVGSTKYAFKEWQVTGATPASTTSASTTLSSPTANVVVNAVFYKPRVIKWSVNGDDSYATGEPTTTVAYNGTISAVPTAPADNTLSCTNKFMGWSTKNAGTTPKTTSYYDDLFTNASGYTTNITAATTTFYAVFAEAETGVWTLDYSKETDLSNSTLWGSYGTAYDYTASDGGTWTVKAYKNSGMQINTAKDASIKIPDCSGNITSIVITCSAAKAVGLSASDYTGSGGITYIAYGTDATSQTIDCSSATATGGYIVPKSGSTSITKIVVNYGSASNYVTQCDANIVKVTYDANGGSTSCTNTTTDKTEDYTVCSTPPTRDYYTFAGWLCSADSKTYAASATISAAAIDADFTLTAQWTPVTYTITYNYNGGSAQEDPVPATSYTVESSDITLQTPTKGHDRFDGWYENADLSTGGVKTTIPAGSHENKTYYAKWTARHEIVFDYTESASSGTTTIYRADDEDLSASVAGQGSVPSDPSAPTACSTKVFVGWSESTIDGETDTEPGDLMKPAAGTVNADKHYYAVWAIEESSSGTETIFTDDFNVTGTDEVTSRSGWTDLSTVYGGSGSIRFSSGKNAGSMTLDVSGMEMSGTWEIKFKIKKYGSDGSGALAVSSAFEDVTTSFSPTSVSTTDGANWTEKTITVTGVHSGTEIHFDGTANSRVYVKDVEIKRTGTITTHSAYSTSCCDKEVTIGTPTKMGSGTVTFESGGNAVSVGGSVKTCNGSTTITATVTPTNGYQCTVLSFTRSDSEDLTPDPAVTVPFTGAHSYDLPFEQNADDVTLNTTVTFVALQDHYIDNMHYNTTQNKSGNYGTAPTLSDESKGEQCTGLHYKFIGWIPETDMNMTTGVPTTTANMVVGGATGKYATGTNYYAIWAEEE